MVDVLAFSSWQGNVKKMFKKKSKVIWRRGEKNVFEINKLGKKIFEKLFQKKSKFLDFSKISKQKERKIHFFSIKIFPREIF